MARLGQVGIALGALGVVLAFMGLFPGVTGVEPTVGIGLVQLVMILTGLSLLVTGAFIYAKYTFYTYTPANLAQQIAMRLSMTGLLLSAMSSMADILGFGSNLRSGTGDILFGPWQAVGLIGGFIIASVGVLIYVLVGSNPPEETENKD